MERSTPRSRYSAQRREQDKKRAPISAAGRNAQGSDAGATRREAVEVRAPNRARVPLKLLDLAPRPLENVA